MKRSDFTKVIAAHGIQGYLLGSAEDRFFRSRKEIEGHQDFELRTCDIAVTLHDSSNALCFPKDGSPFVDITSFEDEHHVSIPAPPGLIERLQDPKSIQHKVRCWVRGDVYQKLKEKAEAEQLDLDAYVARLLTIHAETT